MQWKVSSHLDMQKLPQMPSLDDRWNQQVKLMWTPEALSRILFMIKLSYLDGLNDVEIYIAIQSNFLL